MTTTDADVRSIGLADFGEATDVLVRAFANDPMIQYLGGSSARATGRGMRRFHGTVVKYGMRYGVAEVTSNVTAVAVWLRPGETDYTVPRMITSGWLLSVLGLGISSVRRFLDAYAPLEEARQRAIGTERHWYLQYLAVDPGAQGTGVGSRLLVAGLTRADDDRVPVVLDTMNERNLRFYDRFGFNVATTGELPNGPRYWTLRRDPR